MRTLNDLYQHMEWADALVWRAVLASESARGDQKIRELFHHLHLVQHAYLRAWRGETRDTPYPTFDVAQSLMRWGRAYHDDRRAHFESVTEEELAKPMELPWTDIVARELGQAPANLTIGETMLQVPLHSHYHRGQINTRLREVGDEPPRVDYIVWMWLGRPPTEWDGMQQPA